MKFSDVKVKHIYNVIFDPVRVPEFDRTHLALVLKKNNDNQTVIVMPMTTSSNGVPFNKKDLGILNCLPTSLQSRGNTFAVFNQIRTVNVSRMISLKEKNIVVESKIEDELFIELLSLGMKDLAFNLEPDEKINLFYEISKNESTKKLTSLLYELLKLRKDSEKNSKEIIEIEQKIKDSLIFKNYILDKKDSILQSILDEFLC